MGTCEQVQETREPPLAVVTVSDYQYTFFTVNAELNGIMVAKGDLGK